MTATDFVHTAWSVMLLTLKVGSKAGTTSVSCTCGWEHTYKSRAKAQKRATEHLALNGVTA
ncbi:hypothetical protein [Actinotalea sp.]|uniref:hypothetical protein n=1 Tax=Actinotalea sp. TaxID=1872145 RepID=UPI003566D796